MDSGKPNDDTCGDIMNKRVAFLYRELYSNM